METGASYKKAIVTTDNYVQNILEKTNDVSFCVTFERYWQAFIFGGKTGS